MNQIHPSVLDPRGGGGRARARALASIKLSVTVREVRRQVEDAEYRGSVELSWAWSADYGLL